VLLYQLTGSGWERKQALSALPEDYTGDNIAAAIRMSSDGSRLWISNRGHNSIGMFSVNSDGTLKEAQYCKTGGQT
ncbi:beta-propeller fold lactonase family protein, partial [Klebsiella pneumoniae]|nr:beta-propeller fold lactonase family protein [Klebsiella pneumoniae]